MGKKVKITLPDGRVFEGELEEVKEKSLFSETLGVAGGLIQTILPKEIGQWGSDFAGAYKDGTKLGKGFLKLLDRLFQKEKE